MKIRLVILSCVIMLILGIFKIGYADTGIKAFLNINFGMSVSEVENNIGRKLLTYEEYAKEVKTDVIIRAKKANDSSMLPPAKAESRMETLYIPEIILFGFPAAVKFKFFDSKLSGLGVYFTPDSEERAKKILQEISGSLEKTYEFIKCERSEKLPGAYIKKYKKDSVEGNIWVYLDDPERRHIIAFIYYLPYTGEYYRELRLQDQNVF